MSTNANLPVGFTLTSINGKRCTQVPRSLTTFAGETSFANTTTKSAAPTTVSTTSATSALETTISSTQTQNNSPEVAASTTSTSSAISTSSTSATPEPETTTSFTPSPVAATTTAASIESLTPAAVSSTSPSQTSTSTSALPASKGTTPTISSSTSIPIPQSEVSAKPTSTGIFDDGPLPLTSSRSTTFAISTTASAHAEESSAAAGISSTSRSSPAPVIGGVVGGIALVGFISLLIWFFRRRRRRDSLLTPLTTGMQENFYEKDRGFVGPTKPLAKLTATLGSQSERLREAADGFMAGVAGLAVSFRAKVSGDRKDTLNLNRGNSQFLDGPVPQHSRNNSSALSNNTGRQTVKDRFQNWWGQLTGNMNINGRKNRQSMDPFASARSMTENQANINHQPDFSQLLGMEERELQLQAERRRASLNQSYPNIGGLGLDFSSQAHPQILSDPFADPPTKSSQPWLPPIASKATNPFADPLTLPQPTIPKQNTYITSTRRSRGLSIDNVSPNPPNYLLSSTNHATSIAPTSRYPSTIAPSRDSYRDTVFSSFSTCRKGKGRSDPFDLERPELWLLKNPPMPAPTASTIGLYPDPLRSQTDLQLSEPLATSSAAAVGAVDEMDVPNAGASRTVSAADTYGSKYSSGVSSLAGWGEPGPDLGSQGVSFRGLAGSTKNVERVYGSGDQINGKGGFDEIRSTGELKRDVDVISVASKVSSKGGVGKAL